MSASQINTVTERKKNTKSLQIEYYDPVGLNSLSVPDENPVLSLAWGINSTLRLWRGPFWWGGRVAERWRDKIAEKRKEADKTVGYSFPRIENFAYDELISRAVTADLSCLQLFLVPVATSVLFSFPLYSLEVGRLYLAASRFLTFCILSWKRRQRVHKAYP